MIESTTARARSSEDSSSVPAKAVPLRIALYVLILLSAVAALFVSPALAGAVSRGAISGSWLFIPLAIYGLFFLLYAADRWRLVRARRYPAGKAVFQVAFGVIFASLLLPSTIANYQGDRPEGAPALTAHSDPRVREAAVLAIGFRGPTPERARAVAGSLDDPSPEVRAAAASVLSRWSGLPTGDLAGVRAWASALSRTSTGARGESTP